MKKRVFWKCYSADNRWTSLVLPADPTGKQDLGFWTVGWNSCSVHFNFKGNFFVSGNQLLNSTLKGNWLVSWPSSMSTLRR